MTKIKRLKRYLRHDEVHEVLTLLLSGKIFHVTSNRGIGGILKSGIIHPNSDKRFSLAHGGQIGYGLRNGFVSFFDLRDTSTEGESLLQPHEYLYYPRPNDWSKYSYLIFNPAHYGKLKYQNRNNLSSIESILPLNTKLPSPAESANYIPKFECWFPGKCPLDFISEIINVQIVWDEKERLEQEKRNIWKKYIEPKTNSGKPEFNP